MSVFTRRRTGTLRMSRARALLAGGVATVAAAAMIAPTAASAGQPSPTRPAGHQGGLVPVHGQASRLGTAGGNLSYHGGPVMQSGNTVYTIYWVPSNYSYTVSSTYQSIINGFFTSVAAASGQHTNVYGTDTQYYQYSSANKIQYKVSFGGTVLDTDPILSSGCTDSYTSVCLSDTQIQNEINTVAAANHWTENANTLFVMLTAKGIGSCDGSNSCAFSQYCAYHGQGSNGTLYYANMPYADTEPAACDSGQYPNGDPAADSEINVLSHEHNETITDQQLNAWYDRRGYEDGDKCAWNFGTATGSTAYGKYNQSIGSGHYYLQQEWSNANSGCVLKY